MPHLKTTFKTLSIALLSNCLIFFTTLTDSYADPVDYRLLKTDYFKTVKNGYTFFDAVDDKQEKFKVVNTKTIKGVKIKTKKSWKRHGIFYFYSSGKLKSQAIYNKGKKDGVETKFRIDDGKVASHTSWANGLKHGDETLYNKNGGKSQQCNMENGERHGICQWFHKNGNISTERTYVNDKKHGMMKKFNESGKLSYTEMYENNKKIGNTNWAN